MFQYRSTDNVPLIIYINDVQRLSNLYGMFFRCLRFGFWNTHGKNSIFEAFWVAFWLPFWLRLGWQGHPEASLEAPEATHWPFLRIPEFGVEFNDRLTPKSHLYAGAWGSRPGVPARPFSSFITEELKRIWARRERDMMVEDLTRHGPEARRIYMYI